MERDRFPDLRRCLITVGVIFTIWAFGVPPKSPPAVHAQEMFAGYDRFCGLPVIVGTDPQMASARRFADGRPYLHVDPGVAVNWTTSGMFAVAHECAHHRLGHTTGLGAAARYSGGTRIQELQADCWAAEALMRAGLVSDLRRVVVQQAMQGHFPPGGGYPSGAERARAMIQCGSTPGVEGDDPQTRCSEEIEPCVHPAHQADQVPCEHVARVHAFDLVPCTHWCGYGPCHQADQVPCGHVGPMHASDLVACTHVLHPAGDIRRSCP